MEPWDFAGDEALFMIASAIVAVTGAFKWFIPLLRPRLAPIPGRIALLLAPPAALLALYFVLQSWADPLTVKGHYDYILLFLTGGAAWLAVIAELTRLFGLSLRDDAIDNRNPAAAAVIVGALFGAIAIYAGGNVGCGPTIWTTIFPAFVATAALLILWLIAEFSTALSEMIIIERDLAAGIRHAGWLIASGLVLGRAIAGDWTSWNSTFTDMLKQALPVLPLALVHIIVSRTLRPTPANPRRPIMSAGVIPAVIYILLALAYIIYLGPADIGKTVITYEQYTGHK